MVSESEHHYQPTVKIKLIIQPLATVSSYSPYKHTALNPIEFSKKAIFSFIFGTHLLTSIISNHEQTNSYLISFLEKKKHTMYHCYS